jgi:hypothetical protein
LPHGCDMLRNPRFRQWLDRVVSTGGLLLLSKRSKLRWRPGRRRHQRYSKENGKRAEICGQVASTPAGAGGAYPLTGSGARARRAEGVSCPLAPARRGGGVGGARGRAHLPPCRVMLLLLRPGGLRQPSAVHSSSYLVITATVREFMRGRSCPSCLCRGSACLLPGPSLPRACAGCRSRSLALRRARQAPAPAVATGQKQSPASAMRAGGARDSAGAAAVSRSSHLDGGRRWWHGGWWGAEACRARLHGSCPWLGAARPGPGGRKAAGLVRALCAA